MKKQHDWDPDHYLKFFGERTQPSIDLVSKIKIDYAPRRILDVGCGPGNSSQVLLQRWPKAGLVGVDNSPAMIEKAKKDFPKGKWVLADARRFAPATCFDLVFSNAAIQWIPGHERLLAKFDCLLSPRGVLAVQTPMFNVMPLGRIIQSVSLGKRWKKATAGCSRLYHYHDTGYYYDLLAFRMRKIDMWVTDYIHAMPSHLAIVDWIRSTALKPYLERIADAKDRKDFEKEILREIKKCYPKQKNGNVLYPFKRLFFIGYK
ncbi:MAG: methyltransferase domain-containing protein [Candidatus Aminicenantes bacterium]|nr:methyltransferase domain-containing protein [Candidatus Aminicenantes bacterium]